MNLKLFCESSSIICTSGQSFVHGRSGVCLYVCYYVCVSRQHPVRLDLSRKQGHTLSTRVTPSSCICLSVLMSRWSSWSCSNVSQLAWCGVCTESVTGSPLGKCQYQRVTSLQRKISQTLWRAWCSRSYWLCSARRAVLMLLRPCKTSPWWDLN